ncbi:hypothetical protein G7Z17_g6519 [Cylindrodendrum hubeiense]|uniref:Uncharacterized protein n=1 Tax=Cylindrodendrum hubeiense TaxID=595255 RepID=A0A9P5HC62_9HYPO|nr:hypothetical protein G7Z17_g6519 [Cylindrodendrum hubeiense]
MAYLEKPEADSGWRIFLVDRASAEDVVLRLLSRKLEFNFAFGTPRLGPEGGWNTVYKRSSEGIHTVMSNFLRDLRTNENVDEVEVEIDDEIEAGDDSDDSYNDDNNDLDYIPDEGYEEGETDEDYEEGEIDEDCEEPYDD